MRRENDFEIQFVLNAPRVKPVGLRAQGVDMNMKDNKIFHTTDTDDVQERYYLSSDISQRADELSDYIDKLKSQRDKGTLNKRSKRYGQMDNDIRYWSKKRENVLNNAYRHMIRDLMAKYDITVMEKLTTFDMRKKKRENRGFNKKLTKVRFGTLLEFAQQYANHYNKRLILVKPDMTSQVERGTSYVKKHALDETVIVDGVEHRGWFSEVDGHFVSRDGNSSGNTLDWGLNPKSHFLFPDHPVNKLVFEK
jgi:putative transposase